VKKILEAIHDRRFLKKVDLLPFMSGAPNEEGSIAAGLA
jgi:hypothetical protein